MIERITSDDFFGCKLDIAINKIAIFTGDNGIGKTTLLNKIKSGEVVCHATHGFNRHDIKYITDRCDYTLLTACMSELNRYVVTHGYDLELERFTSIIDVLLNKKQFSSYLMTFYKRMSNGDEIPFHYRNLTVGEIRIFCILASAFLAKLTPTNILIIDSPEMGLHIKRQRKLIDWILQINPNIQLILATHSQELQYDACEISLNVLLE